MPGKWQLLLTFVFLNIIDDGKYKTEENIATIAKGDE